MIEKLLENDYWTVTYDASKRLVVTRRTSKPLPADNSDFDPRQLDGLLLPAVRAKTALLIDMRAAPFRNDPAFEKQAAERGARLRPFVEGYARVATLVATAVGRLQAMRVGRERTGLGLHVFVDEGEALAYLLGPQRP